MSLLTKVGRFSLSASDVGHIRTVNGVGFTGKAVIIWGQRRDGTNGSFISGLTWTFGAAGNHLDDDAAGGSGFEGQGCVFMGADNHSGGFRIHGFSGKRIVRAKQAESAPGTTDAENLRLVEYTPDGFRIEVAGTISGTIYFNYLVIGGCDLEEARLYQLSDNTTPGAKSITGAGFRPDALIAFNVGYGTAAENAFLQHCRTSYGMAARDATTPTTSTVAGQGCSGFYSYDTSHNSRGITLDDAVLAFPNELSTENRQYDAKYSVTSFDADGVSLSLDAPLAAGIKSYFLLLKGGRYEVSKYLTPTVVAAEEAFPTSFQYRGLLAMSALRPIKSIGSLRLTSIEIGSSAANTNLNVSGSEITPDCFLDVTLTNVPSYNTRHRLTDYISSNVVRSAVPFVANSGAGRWAYPEIGGTVTLSDNGDGKYLLTFSADHGLSAGQTVRVLPVNGSIPQQIVLASTPTSTTAISGTAYVASESDVPWFFSGHSAGTNSRAPVNYRKGWISHAYVAIGAASSTTQARCDWGSAYNNWYPAQTGSNGPQSGHSSQLLFSRAYYTGGTTPLFLKTLTATQFTAQTNTGDEIQREVFVLGMGNNVGDAPCPVTIATPTGLTVTKQVLASGLSLDIDCRWDKDPDQRDGLVQSFSQDLGGSGHVVIQLPSNHTFAVGDSIRIVGSQKASYNTDHDIVGIYSPTAVITNIAYDGVDNAGTATWSRLNYPWKYQVQRSPDGIDWVTVVDKPYNSFNPSEVQFRWRDQLLLPGTYHYRVRASNQDGSTSEWTTSASDTIADFPTSSLSAPFSPVAVRLSGIQVRLTWAGTPALANQRFEIQRSTDGGVTWVRIYYSSTPENITTYDDLNAPRGFEYRYRVRQIRTPSAALGSGATWQNQDNRFDVNNDGEVSVEDLRAVQSWLINSWPDFGVSVDSPTGSARPSISPPGVPPSELYIDVNGNDVVDADDLASMRAMVSGADMPVPSRSAWSTVAVLPGDMFSEHLYWASYSEQSVRSMWTTGDDVQDLVPGTKILGRPVGITLDYSTGQLFFTTFGEEEPDAWVYTTRFDGRALVTGDNVDLVAKVDGKPISIAADTANQRLYFFDLTSNSLRRISYLGASPSTIIDSGTGLFNEPRGLAIDEDGEHVYWVERGSQKVRRADLDGSNITDIVTIAAANDLYDIKLDVDEFHIYACSPADGKIFRCDMDGDNLSEIISGHPNCYGLAVSTTTDELFWTSGSPDSQSIYTDTKALAGAAEVVDGLYYPTTLVHAKQGGNRPAAPTSVVSYRHSDTEVRITWTPSAFAFHEQTEVFRRDDSSSPWRIIGFTSDSEFLDTLATPDSQYRVRAVAASVWEESSSWQNQQSPYDVDDDALPTVQDYHLVRDWLRLFNDPNSTPTPAGPPSQYMAGYPFLDVTGDGEITEDDLVALTTYIDSPQSYYVVASVGPTTTASPEIPATTCPPVATTGEFYISDPADNGWWGDDGVIEAFTSVEQWLGSSDDFPHEGVYEHAYLRYVLGIPAGSAIHWAQLEFTADGHSPDDDDPGTIELKIAAELEADSTAIASFATADTVSGDLTVAQVDWDSLPVWLPGETYLSPDIGPVIQELIDQGGWAEDNHITLFILDDNASAGGSSRHPTLLRTGDPPTTGTRLIVCYTPPAGPTTTAGPTTSTTTTTTTTTTPGPYACQAIWFTDTRRRRIVNIPHLSGSETVFEQFDNPLEGPGGWAADLVVRQDLGKVFYLLQPGAYVSGGGIYSTNIDGSDNELLVDFDEADDNDVWPARFAVDAAGEFAYVSDAWNYSIYKCDLTSGDIEEFVEGTNPASDVALDTINVRLYVIRRDLPHIFVYDADGELETTINPGTGRRALSLFVDSEENWIYYSAAVTGGYQIRRCSLAGEVHETLFSISGEVTVEPRQLIMDKLADAFLWVREATNEIVRCDLDGSNLTVVHKTADSNDYVPQTFGLQICGSWLTAISSTTTTPAATTTTTPAPVPGSDCAVITDVYYNGSNYTVEYDWTVLDPVAPNVIIQRSFDGISWFDATYAFNDGLVDTVSLPGAIGTVYYLRAVQSDIDDEPICEGAVFGPYPKPN